MAIEFIHGRPEWLDNVTWDRCTASESPLAAYWPRLEDEGMETLKTISKSPHPGYRRCSFIEKVTLSRQAETKLSPSKSPSII